MLKNKSIAFKTEWSLIFLDVKKSRSSFNFDCAKVMLSDILKICSMQMVQYWPTTFMQFKNLHW